MLKVKGRGIVVLTMIPYHPTRQFHHPKLKGKREMLQMLQLCMPQLLDLLDGLLTLDPKLRYGARFSTEIYTRACH
jgi:hypothetical protein